MFLLIFRAGLQPLNHCHWNPYSSHVFDLDSTKILRQVEGVTLQAPKLKVGSTDKGKELAELHFSMAIVLNPTIYQMKNNTLKLKDVALHVFI